MGALRGYRARMLQLNSTPAITCDAFIHTMILRIRRRPCVCFKDWGSLDRVLRSAARLIGGIPTFGHVSQYMLDVLRWLPAEQRISFRIALLIWRCLVGLAPFYLRELCCPPLVLWARDHSAHPNKVSFLFLLPVPPLSRSVPSPWWAPQPGTAFFWTSHF